MISFGIGYYCMATVPVANCNDRQARTIAREASRYSTFEGRPRFLSGERTLLAYLFRLLAETILINCRRQAADDSRLAACAPQKNGFGETPKPTRETRALPVVVSPLPLSIATSFGRGDAPRSRHAPRVN